MRRQRPLISAAQNGNVDAQSDSSSEELSTVRDHNNSTLLDVAANPTFLLLGDGMPPNILNKYMQSPAHLAACQGNLLVLEVFLRHHDCIGEEVDEKNLTHLDWEVSPLYSAVFDDDVDKIKDLLRLADPYNHSRMLYRVSPSNYRNKTSTQVRPYELKNNMRSLFLKNMSLAAAQSGNLAVLRDITFKDLKVTDPITGWNMLHAAVIGNQIEGVKLLLEKGISPEEVNEYEQTPAHIAAFKGHLDILDILIERHHHLFEEIQDESSMTYKDWLATPLYEAVESNDTQQVKRLLKLGADPNYKGRILYKGWPSQYSHNECAYDLAHKCRNDTLPLFQKTAANDEERETRQLYNVNTYPRGYVCILNYEEFADENSWREGSHKDVVRITRLFDRMGYKCVAHSNMTTRKTKQTLNKLQNDNILDDVSCLIVFVMSHGDDRQTFKTHDGTLTTRWLLELFRDNECPKLKNKAKLFFFQFCRGDFHEEQVESNDSAVNEIDKSPFSFKRPKLERPVKRKETLKDMWCLYSTVEDFVSMRSPALGAPFIKAVCDAIEEHAWDRDLDDIFQSFLEIYEKLPYATVPEMNNFKFKKFFFNPVGVKSLRSQFSLSHLR